MEAVAVVLFALFVALCLRVLARTRSVSVLLLLILSYNYLLHGYVVVFFYEALGYSLGDYWYDGFPYFISYDHHYWGAAVVSLLFANTYLLAWSVLPLREHRLRKMQDDTLSLRGWPLLILGAGTFAIGILPWIDFVLTYLRSGESAYLAFKSGEQLGVYVGLLKWMLSITSMSLCILFVAGIGLSNRLVIPTGRSFAIFWALVIISGVLLFGSMMALGDRVTLLEGGLAAVVLASFRGIRGARAIFLVLLFVVPLIAIGVFREAKESAGPSELLSEAVGQIVVNAESRTAFSQYIVMSNRIEPYPGGSLTYLTQIMLPRFWAEDRPEEGPYEHYAAAAGLPARLGWGINLMTDCYMNYGLGATVVAALLLGALHWGVFRFACVSVTGQFVFSGLVAAYPISIRSGIPGLKGMVMGMGLGYLLCIVSCKRGVRMTMRS